MLIVIEHVITNSNDFFRLIPKVAEAPAGIKAIQFFPSTDKDRAVCLWEAKSLEALKGFFEPLSSQCSRNTYYVVDGAQAIGLPTMAAAA